MSTESDYIQIDAVRCRKRFHCRFRPDQPTQDNVEFKCPECNATLATFTDSPPLDFCRHENLINLNHLSEHQSRECHFFKKPIR